MGIVEITCSFFLMLSIFVGFCYAIWANKGRIPIKRAIFEAGGIIFLILAAAALFIVIMSSHGYKINSAIILHPVYILLAFVTGISFLVISNLSEMQ